MPGSPPKSLCLQRQPRGGCPRLSGRPRPSHLARSPGPATRPGHPAQSPGPATWPSHPARPPGVAGFSARETPRRPEALRAAAGPRQGLGGPGLDRQDGAGWPRAAAAASAPGMIRNGSRPNGQAPRSGCLVMSDPPSTPGSPHPGPGPGTLFPGSCGPECLPSPVLRRPERLPDRAQAKRRHGEPHAESRFRFVIPSLTHNSRKH